MSQKSYATEGLSLTRPLAFVDKIQQRFVRSNDKLKFFVPVFFYS